MPFWVTSLKMPLPPYNSRYLSKVLAFPRLFLYSYHSTRSLTTNSVFCQILPHYDHDVKRTLELLKDPSSLTPTRIRRRSRLSTSSDCDPIEDKSQADSRRNPSIPSLLNDLDQLWNDLNGITTEKSVPAPKSILRREKSFVAPPSWETETSLPASSKDSGPRLFLATPKVTSAASDTSVFKVPSLKRFTSYSKA